MRVNEGCGVGLGGINGDKGGEIGIRGGGGRYLGVGLWYGRVEVE